MRLTPFAVYLNENDIYVELDDGRSMIFVNLPIVKYNR